MCACSCPLTLQPHHPNCSCACPLATLPLHPPPDPTTTLPGCSTARRCTTWTLCAARRATCCSWASSWPGTRSSSGWPGVKTAAAQRRLTRCAAVAAAAAAAAAGGGGGGGAAVAASMRTIGSLFQQQMRCLLRACKSTVSHSCAARHLSQHQHPYTCLQEASPLSWSLLCCLQAVNRLWKVMLCTFFFTMANFLKAMLTKFMSTHFYRTAHFKKVKQAIEKVRPHMLSSQQAVVVAELIKCSLQVGLGKAASCVPGTCMWPDFTQESGHHMQRHDRVAHQHTSVCMSVLDPWSDPGAHRYSPRGQSDVTVCCMPRCTLQEYYLMMLSQPRPHKLEPEPLSLNHTASIFGTVLKRRVTGEPGAWGSPSHAGGLGSPSADGRPGHYKSWSLGAHCFFLLQVTPNMGARCRFQLPSPGLADAFHRPTACLSSIAARRSSRRACVFAGVSQHNHVSTPWQAPASAVVAAADLTEPSFAQGGLRSLATRSLTMFKAYGGHNSLEMTAAGPEGQRPAHPVRSRSAAQLQTPEARSATLQSAHEGNEVPAAAPPQVPGIGQPPAGGEEQPPWDGAGAPLPGLDVLQPPLVTVQATAEGGPAPGCLWSRRR